LIQNYLNTSRYIIAHQVFDEHYKHIFNSLKKNHVDLELVVTYSLNRDCELFFTDEKKILIYDQYLGETFNDLNKLFFSAKNENDGLLYCMKLAGEYLQLGGYLIPSLAFSNAFSNNRKNILQEADNLIEIRSTFTGIQEYFIIAHELCHCALSLNKNEKLFKSTKEFIRENCLDVFNQDDFPTEKFIDVFTDSLIEGLKISNPDKTSISDKVRKQIDIDPEQFLLGRRHLIEEREDFIEEIICDEIATNTLLSLKIAPTNIIIRGVFIGLMNLRLLSLVNRMVNNIKSEKKLNDFFFESLLRLSVFRKLFETRIKLFYGNEKMIELSELLTKDNKRYSKILTNQLLFSIQVDINDMINHKNDITNKKYSFEEKKELNNLIQKILR